jgi:hypothetical protein
MRSILGFIMARRGKRAGSQRRIALRDEQTEREAIERDFAKRRRKQTGRGGLLNFVRYFCHTLEPKTRPIAEGWVLEAICMHLEAITFGDIESNRLLISSSLIAAPTSARRAAPSAPGSRRGDRV